VRDGRAIGDDASADIDGGIEPPNGPMGWRYVATHVDRRRCDSLAEETLES
jgi:hypothetical protein